VPFTLRNIKKDLEDVGPRFDGAPDGEFRAATKALELEKSALSYQGVPPGYRLPPHTHDAGGDTAPPPAFGSVRGRPRLRMARVRAPLTQHKWRRKRRDVLLCSPLLMPRTCRSARECRP